MKLNFRMAREATKLKDKLTLLYCSSTPCWRIIRSPCSPSPLCPTIMPWPSYLPPLTSPPPWPPPSPRCSSASWPTWWLKNFSQTFQVEISQTYCSATSQLHLNFLFLHSMHLETELVKYSEEEKMSHPVEMAVETVLAGILFATLREDRLRVPMSRRVKVLFLPEDIWHRCSGFWSGHL